MRTRASHAAVAVLAGCAALLMMVSAPAAQEVKLKWYGQAAFKITSPGGRVILVDPFITRNPKTPDALKDLSKLGQVDLILVTHGHGDHVGDTVEIAKMTGAKVGLNADLGRTFASIEWLPMEQMLRFNKGGSIRPLGPDIAITMVRAEHSSDVTWTNPMTGKETVLPGGEPAGFIIELENGYKIYHAGDTGVFADMNLIREYYEPNLALLPIGGHFTMDPKHAAHAVRNLLKTPAVIPMHYGTFPVLKGTPEEFQAALGDAPSKVIVMTPGQEIDL